MKISVSILALLLCVIAGAVVRAGDSPAATTDGRTVFSNSLAPVPVAAHDLTAAQPVAAGEPVSFQIALRQQPDGKAPEADYESLVRWLQERGLTVSMPGPSAHTSIEATGTVDRVSKALEMRFGRVEVGGRSYVAAASAPSLPAPLGGAVIGINGLQPFAHMNKGPIFVQPGTAKPTAR